MRRSSGVPEQVRSSSPSSSCSSPVRSIHIPVPRAGPEPEPEPRRMNRTLFGLVRIRAGSGLFRTGSAHSRAVSKPGSGPAGPKVSFFTGSEPDRACTSVHVRPAESRSSFRIYGFFFFFLCNPEDPEPCDLYEPSSGWTRSWNSRTPLKVSERAEPSRANRVRPGKTRTKRKVERSV